MRRRNFLYLSILIISILFCSVTCYGQKAWEGTNTGKWSRAATFLRVGFGAQRSAYSELGIARVKMREGEMLGAFALRSYYTSLEWTPTFWPEKPENIFGWKLGYEGSFIGLGYGLDLKYQTDFRYRNDVVLMPKIGFNIVIVSMYYGYNISFCKTPFEEIGHHQFSLIFHYNSGFFRKQK